MLSMLSGKATEVFVAPASSEGRGPVGDVVVMMPGGAVVMATVSAAASGVRSWITCCTATVALRGEGRGGEGWG